MGTSGKVAGLALAKRPETREELRMWVLLYTGLNLAKKALCEGHQVPLDYLAYSFFEAEGGEGSGDAVVWACRGGGKTMIGAVATLLDMLFKPGVQVRILGGSREQSEKMYLYLCELVRAKFSGQLRGEIRRRGFSFANGSRVEILAQSARSVRGTRVQKVRCDEVELFDEEVWAAAQLTTRSLLKTQSSGGRALNSSPQRHRATENAQRGIMDGREAADQQSPVVARGAVEVFSTMHRPGGLMQRIWSGQGGAQRKVFTWCIWDVISRCHPSRPCATCPLFAECGGRAKDADGFVPVEDVIAMKQRVSLPTWESEMLCHVPYSEKQVFAGFSHTLHVREFDLSRGQPQAGETVMVGERVLTVEKVVAGVDFGWLRFACLWMAMLRDPKGQRVVWVLDEYVKAQKTLAGNVEAIRSRPVRVAQSDAWEPAVVHCDVAGKQTDSHTGESSEAVLRKAGFVIKSRAQPVEAGLGRINDLIEPAMNGAGAEARFFVMPSCGKLISALQGYQFDAKGKPVKDGEHDHLIDALRYAIVGESSRGGKLEVKPY